MARPGEEYTVRVPATPQGVYHLVPPATLEGLTDRHFESNAARPGKPRYWPDEDAADYCAISCFDTPELALANAKVYDRQRQRGEPPRWEGIAYISVVGDVGHALAQTGEDGHYSVWGEADKLRSSATHVIPI